MKHAIAILAVLMSAPNVAAAQEHRGLEAGLLRAMSYSQAKGERLEQPGEAIRSYIDLRLVDRKPTARMDYTDYRVLNAPASLLGQKLLVLEEEYMTKYVGCCVSEGVGAILQIDGDDATLRTFAEKNRCSIDEKYVRETLGQLHLKPNGRVASISCRMRDAQETPPPG